MNTFENCVQLSDVYFTGNVSDWCAIDFHDSYSNPMFYADNFYIKGKLVTELIIPDGITSIRKNVFCGCTGITSVTIPDSVTSIDNYAFKNCTSLSNITIPNNVISIGDFAFSGCEELTSVTIGNSVTSIGSYAFHSCTALTNVVIPGKVTSIGDSAFYYCNKLTNITISDSVISIGDYAFKDCKLTSITIPASVTNIGDCAFRDCAALTSITVDSANAKYSSDEYGVLFDKDKTKLIQFPAGNTKESYVIPDNVISIGNYAFYYCPTLKSITIPSSVTRIGSHAFSYYTGLTSITIPDSVTSIGGYAFYCTALEYVHIPASVTSIGDYAFHYTNAYICSTTEDCYAKTYAVENDITFKVCTGNNGEAPETNELKTGTDADTNISYSYENGCFEFNGEEYEGEVDFEVIIKDKADYEDAFRGYADESDDIFSYKIKFYALDENDNRKGEIQPVNGKKVKIGFPIPAGYETANSNLFMVLHKRSDNNKLEFFKPSNNNIEVKDGYIYIWTDNFSPFALVVNYNENASIVSSISIASLPSKTSYTYKSNNLDISGLALTVTYSDGTTETVTDTSAMKVSGFDNKKIGTQTVTVEYEGYTAEFEVTVSYAWWQWIIRILLLGFLWY